MSGTNVTVSVYDTDGAVSYTVIVVCWYSVGLLGILYNKFRSELKTAQVVYALKRKQSLNRSTAFKSWWRPILNSIRTSLNKLSKIRRRPVERMDERQSKRKNTISSLDGQTSLFIYSSASHHRSQLFESDYEHLRVLETLADINYRSRAWNAYFGKGKLPNALQLSESATLAQIKKRMSALQFDISMQSRIRNSSLTAAATAQMPFQASGTSTMAQNAAQQVLPSQPLFGKLYPLNMLV
ncbi:hypothetical protein ACOME3_009065 [Neoechinorhynchus agilis]